MFNYPPIDARLKTVKYLIVERESCPVTVGALNSAEVREREIREDDEYQLVIEEAIEGGLDRAGVRDSSRRM